MPRITISVTEQLNQLILNAAQQLHTTPSDIVKRATLAAVKPYNDIHEYNQVVTSNYSQCAQCGQYYWAKTVRSMYCDSSCRNRAFWQRKKNAQL